MSKVRIEQTENNRVRVTNLTLGGSIESQTVEANLLFAILDKLEEIKNGLIDVEEEVRRK